MKSIIITLLLLAAIAGRGQDLKSVFLLSDTAEKPTYDTIKVIAEVYAIPAKRYMYGRKDSVFAWWYQDGPKSYYLHGEVDSTVPEVKYVLAWEVWRKEYLPTWTQSAYGPKGAMIDTWQWHDVELIKRLSYNRKDELSNVLQTWGVEW